MKSVSFCSGLTVLILFVSTFGCNVAFAEVFEVDQDTLLSQSWESGIGNWWADNGLWEVGIPIVGPDSAHSPSNCAGTDLDGNYPSNANTRLISPQITLPGGLPLDERIRLRFWHWFRLYESSFGPDEGRIQISVNGGNWQTLAGPFSGTSPVWTQVYVDLTEYADSTVRIGFYLTSDWTYEDNGWYVDDVAIIVGTEAFSPTDFENGMGDWWVDNGLWEAGIPAVGPDSAHSPLNCVGTNLNANYPSDANTRLVSPRITLPGGLASDERIRLRFWQWFRLYESSFGPDEGRIQISVNDGIWQTLAGPFSGTSPVWTQVYVDLTEYADSTVRIGFYFTSDWTYEDNGWYVDDAAVIIGPEVFNSPEDFEDGMGDWWVDNGLWEAGIPAVGPDSAHSPLNCVGTNLNANYPSDANTRLVSPRVTLTPAPGYSPGLYFWHWFRLYESAFGPDQGYIQISVDDGNWQTLVGPFSGTSPNWSQVYVDLSDYADSTVRIAFYLASDWTYEDNGWYVDDIRLEGIMSNVNDPAQVSNVPKSFALAQNYPNPFNATTAIRYYIPRPDVVKVEIYNILGQKVATLCDGLQQAGYHTITWDASNVSSGIYFTRLQSNDQVMCIKMVLVK
jgi:bacillopeptidase F (M6 metalloprotease family)